MSLCLAQLLSCESFTRYDFRLPDAFTDVKVGSFKGLPISRDLLGFAWICLDICAIALDSGLQLTLCHGR